VASVVLGAGAGELVAGLFLPGASPLAVVGSALIDLAPAWAKDAAISLFGTNDKTALLIGVGVVALVLAGLAGWLEARRPPWGRAVVLVLGAVGAVAAMTRADSGVLSWVPSAVAGVVAALTLWWLLRMLRPGAAAVDPGDRRRFLLWAGGATAVGLLAAVGGSLQRAGSQAAATARSMFRLPRAAVAAPPVPAGAQLDVLALAPVVTPNREFYRIDTALVVPQVDPATWSLRIHGMVDQEVVLTWDELIALPLEESWTTLTCVSNPVGGDLIGNAKWLGYPVRHLLERAAPKASADMVLSRSIDGFTASTPIGSLTDDTLNAILAIGMNDEPLPTEHGFPVRMVVPGLYGYVSATKWITELEVTRFDKASAYWTQRGWSERGPIKLQSRIDVPRRNQGLSPGETVIAGVAWQQHVGISKVEVQVDGGPWREATLATAISVDTWVQWSIPWTAEKGSHAIRCRATTARGELQTEVDAWPTPNGATGWQQLNIDVA
jgi:DMSO/TMAO reductase YedYZ molybdopterin-dependent catalytic subunit